MRITKKRLNDRLKRMLGSLALAAALTVPINAEQAWSQSTVNATATIQIPQVLFISVDETAITFNSPAVDATDFEAGFKAADQVSVVTHKGNIVHDVEIKADATDFTAAADPVNNIKSAADFQYSTDGGSNFASITTTAADVVTAAPKGANTQQVNYQILLSYADAPDTYTLGFTYTIVAN
jgi:hypothetical protein